MTVVPPPPSITTVRPICQERIGQRGKRCGRRFEVQLGVWFDYITGPCCAFPMPCPTCVPEFPYPRTAVES